MDWQLRSGFAGRCSFVAGEFGFWAEIPKFAVGERLNSFSADIAYNNAMGMANAAHRALLFTVFSLASPLAAFLSLFKLFAMPGLILARAGRIQSVCP
jgi:hypothetical protein